MISSPRCLEQLPRLPDRTKKPGALQRPGSSFRETPLAHPRGYNDEFVPDARQRAQALGFSNAADRRCRPKRPRAGSDWPAGMGLGQAYPCWRERCCICRCSSSTVVVIRRASSGERYRGHYRNRVERPTVPRATWTISARLRCEAACQHPSEFKFERQMTTQDHRRALGCTRRRWDAPKGPPPTESILHVRTRGESGYFALLSTAAVDDRRLSHTAYRVLGSLARYANTAGECWPAQSTIARRLGLGLRTVVRAIADLETYGYVYVIRQLRTNGMGGKGVSRYLLLYPRPAALKTAELPAMTKASGPATD
jgi:hypothetical protein